MSYRYTVLRLGSEKHPRHFRHHEDAFLWCEALTESTKGVYRIIKAGTLGGVNVFGSSSTVHEMEYHSEYKFKVI